MSGSADLTTHIQGMGIGLGIYVHSDGNSSVRNDGNVNNYTTKFYKYIQNKYDSKYLHEKILTYIQMRKRIKNINIMEI